MSDHFIPIGKYVPPSPQPVEIPGQYNQMNPMSESSDPTDLSFHEMLNRQMKTSSQTRTLQVPPVEIPQPSHFSSAPSRALEYNPQTELNPVEEVDINDPAMPPEVREVLMNAPAQPAPDMDWSPLILQNTQEYTQMKAVGELNTAIIPDLGSSHLTKPTPSEPPQARITPAYSAFDLSRVTSKTLGAAKPINADLMNGADYNALSQADVKPLTEETPKQTNHATPSSNRRVKGKAIAAGEPLAEETQPKPEEADKPKEGVGQAVGSVFQNIASGLTFGLYRPKGETEAQGVARIVYPFKKLVWDTPVSVLVGVPKGIAHSVSQGREEKEEGRQIARVGSTYTGSSKPWLSRHRGVRTQEEAPETEIRPPVMEQVTQRPKWVG